MIKHVPQFTTGRCLHLCCNQLSYTVNGNQPQMSDVISKASVLISYFPFKRVYNEHCTGCESQVGTSPGSCFFFIYISNLSINDVMKGGSSRKMMELGRDVMFLPFQHYVFSWLEREKMFIYEGASQISHKLVLTFSTYTNSQIYLPLQMFPSKYQNL